MLSCPSCGGDVIQYRNPVPTVDIIIELGNGIVLIERRNPPYGWALPGGFVDYGESLEDAAKREAKEETKLDIFQLMQLGSYSDPTRDNRLHTISTVFVAKAQGIPTASDDAKNIKVCELSAIPANLCFDHSKIIADYFLKKKYCLSC